MIRHLAEIFFLGLRKTGGINLKLFPNATNRTYESVSKQIKDLEELSRDLWNSTVNIFHLRLTRKGLLLSNEVFSKFIK